MRRIVAPLLAALACLSCAPPPFNLDLSLSARTVNKLSLEGTVGPIDNFSDQGLLDAAFLPEKGATSGIDLQNGFVLLTEPPGSRKLVFVFWDSANGMYRKLGSELWLGPVSTDMYPGFTIHALKGASHVAGLFRFHLDVPPNSSDDNDFTLLQADPSREVFPVSQNPINLLTNYASTELGVPDGDVIGSSIAPDNSPTGDHVCWLIRERATDTYLEVTYPIDGIDGIPNGGPLLPRGAATYSLSAFMPPGLDRILYYYDADTAHAPQRSFVSWYEAATKKWKCWTWWGITGSADFKELPDVDHRIDALLTSGELLSTEGDVGRLYSRDGALESTFPLTGIRFIEEAYIDGAARLLFSQSLQIEKRPWFNLYSIPTADVRTLAQ